MKWMLMATALAVLVSCHTNPPVPPSPPDASDAAVVLDAPREATPEAAPAPMTDCQRACAALAAAGCLEGKVPNCVAEMTTIDTYGDTRTPDGPALTCAAVAAISTADQAHKLGITCAP